MTANERIRGTCEKCGAAYDYNRDHFPPGRKLPPCLMCSSATAPIVGTDRREGFEELEAAYLREIERHTATIRERDALELKVAALTRRRREKRPEGSGRAFWHTYARRIAIGDDVTIEDDRGLRSGSVVFLTGRDVVVELDEGGAEILRTDDYDASIEEDPIALVDCPACGFGAAFETTERDS